MEIAFVAFDDDQLDPCVPLFIAAFAGPPWHEHHTVETARDRLTSLRALPGQVGLVAWPAGKDRPVGLAVGQLQPNNGATIYRLNEFCVAPDQQGNGLGRYILRQIEQTAAGLGASEIVLMTSAAVAGFYVKHGYALRDSGAEESWLTLVRRLSQDHVESE